MQYLNCVPVVQHGQIYQVYIPQGLLVVQMLSRGNGLILKDMKALDKITKATQELWDIYPPPKKSGR